MILDSKVALVNGGGGTGVGAMTARELTSRGARVIVNYRSNEPWAQEVVEAIIAAGGEAREIRADIIDEQEVAQMVNEIVGIYGRLDILVSSKGGSVGEGVLSGWNRAFLDLTWEAFAARINGELQAAFTVTKAVVPVMERQKYGHLVYVSSEHSRGPAAPGMIANGTAKAGLNTFVVYLAHELGMMAVLSAHGEQTISTLAQQLSVDAPAITAIVGRLEQSALVERVHDREDRRVVKVSLTVEGQDIICSLDPVVAAFNARIVPPDQRQAFLEQLYHLIATVSTVAPGVGDRFGFLAEQLRQQEHMYEDE